MSTSTIARSITAHNFTASADFVATMRKASVEDVASIGKALGIAERRMQGGILQARAGRAVSAYLLQYVHMGNERGSARRAAEALEVSPASMVTLAPIGALLVKHNLPATHPVVATLLTTTALGNHAKLWKHLPLADTLDMDALEAAIKAAGGKVTEGRAAAKLMRDMAADVAAEANVRADRAAAAKAAKPEAEVSEGSDDSEPVASEPVVLSGVEALRHALHAASALAVTADMTAEDAAELLAVAQSLAGTLADRAAAAAVAA